MATARCWLEVDLSALARNVDSAREMLGSRLLIPVLKGNAYGMGAVPVARFLHGMGIGLFAVASAAEALELRGALPGADVLAMGMVEPPFIGDALKSGLILALAGERQAELLSAEAVRLGCQARVHVKINTGLNRIGFDADQGVEPILSALRLPGIRAEGVFTHLALHGEPADRAQMAALDRLSDALAENGHTMPMRHALDSIGMARYPDAPYDAARLGAWLWGVVPAGYDGPQRCVPIQRFRAKVAQIRKLSKGALVGYDDKHPLTRDSRVATISAGYADGYPRLSSTGHVEIHGLKAPLLGIVGMDALMVDVTDVPQAREGDIATLLGGSIGLWNYADWANTNRNDAISRVSRRVPRVYIEGGRPVSIANYNIPCEEVHLP